MFEFMAFMANASLIVLFLYMNHLQRIMCDVFLLLYKNKAKNQIPGSLPSSASSLPGPRTNVKLALGK